MTSPTLPTWRLEFHLDHQDEPRRQVVLPSLVQEYPQDHRGLTL